MSRSAVHFLLSILLLFSQQVSLLHGVSHWDEAREASSQQVLLQDDDGSGTLPKPTPHQACMQCALSAQMAYALPAMVYAFAPLDLAYDFLPAPRIAGICLLTSCGYQPRGPPQA